MRANGDPAATAFLPLLLFRSFALNSSQGEIR